MNRLSKDLLEAAKAVLSASYKCPPTAKDEVAAYSKPLNMLAVAVNRAEGRKKR